MPTNAARVRLLRNLPLAHDGAYVLYWMTTARRLGYNFGLQRAVEMAVETRRPLVIFEALRVEYPYASERLHAFVLDGMAEHQGALAGSRARYYPYVEPQPAAGRGLLTALAAHAVAIVTDWYPAFFIPRMLDAAADAVSVRLEAVDSNGLMPIAAAGRAFATAHAFRAHLQRTLRHHLREWPEADPLRQLPPGRAAALPRTITSRWPAATTGVLQRRTLGALPIDHDVPPVAMRGGTRSATARLREFVAHGLDRYAGEHHQPESNATSRLSPWLHFGHVSAHEVFDAVMKKERWSMRKLPARSRGARSGWWNVSPSAEAFLDELITWRELAFNGAAYIPASTSLTSLPSWARNTIDAHRGDPRPHLYGLATFERAATHDPLWNAIQRQLVREGWFHGYMRMLWGKKILEWSTTPEAALATMEHLMNRYALDGRDPNSWAGFLWVFGRYDRPWPEREVFGTLRYMSSQNTARKLRVKKYVAEYGSR